MVLTPFQMTKGENGNLDLRILESFKKIKEVKKETFEFAVEDEVVSFIDSLKALNTEQERYVVIQKHKNKSLKHYAKNVSVAEMSTSNYKKTIEQANQSVAAHNLRIEQSGIKAKAAAVGMKALNVAIGFSNDLFDSQIKKNNSFDKYHDYDGPVHKIGDIFAQGYFHHWSGSNSSIFSDLPDKVLKLSVCIIKGAKVEDLNNDEKYLFSIAIKNKLFIKK